MPQAIEGMGTSERQWAQWQGWEEFPALPVERLVPPQGRAVVVSPHPDDEVLGCGGVIASLAAAGRETLLIAVTDGCASHPGSEFWPPQRLRKVRPAETSTALSILEAGQCRNVRLGVEDGQIAAHVREIAERVRELLQPGDVILTTWRQDGHPDHEATGEASFLAARDMRVQFAEYPVWAWHWSSPGDARFPWHRLCRIPLADRACQLKREALRAFRSQTEPDPSTGAAPILPPHVLSRFLRPFESFLL